MGLALRDLEADPAYFKRLQLLRDRIFSKYGDEGLHIAQVVQSGILVEVFDAALKSSLDQRDLAEFIETTLNQADKFCVFIQETDNPKRRAQEILTRLDANRPQFMYLLSRGKANDILRAVYKELRDRALDYEWSRKEDGTSVFLRLSRKRPRSPLRES